MQLSLLFRKWPKLMPPSSTVSQCKKNCDLGSTGNSYDGTISNYSSPDLERGELGESMHSPWRWPRTREFVHSSHLIRSSTIYEHKPSPSGKANLKVLISKFCHFDVNLHNSNYKEVEQGRWTWMKDVYIII
jgi:hypothetical protein